MASSFLDAVQPLSPIFDESRACFRRNGVIQSGLLPTLRAVFFPTYLHRKSHSHPRGSRFVVEKSRGIRVHAQLAALCDIGTLPSDLLARQIVESLNSRGIRLIACEVPICDPDTHVATAIDAVGEDTWGRVVIIEFKAGYQHSTHGHGPLPNLAEGVVPSTALNHAMLQLGMTRAILREKYHIEAHQYLLIVSNGKGVTLRALPAWTNKLTCEQLKLRWTKPANTTVHKT
jgi:hypothetical protein